MIWIRANINGSINLVSMVQRDDCVGIDTDLTFNELTSGKYLFLQGEIVDNPDYTPPLNKYWIIRDEAYFIIDVLEFERGVGDWVETDISKDDLLDYGKYQFKRGDIISV